MKRITLLFVGLTLGLMSGACQRGGNDFPSPPAVTPSETHAPLSTGATIAPTPAQ